MKRLIFIVVFIIVLIGNAILACAQGEQNIWTFGDKTGLSFSSAPPAPYNNNLFAGEEGCASICDATGLLLFYSDGFWVWNRSHELMPGLTGGIPGYTAPIAMLVGYPPLMPYTGGFATQAAAICGVPAHAGKFYLFSLNTDGQLFYSIIDISLNSGNGDLVPGKKGIYIGGGFTEKMTLTKGCNNIWLVTRSRTMNEYLSYAIMDTGLVMNPVISASGVLPVSWYRCGVIKFSPDGERMAAASNDASTSTGGLELYDFDYHTGVISNAAVLDSSSTSGYYYGACFSPDNTKLYVSTSSYSNPASFHPGRVSQFNVGLNSVPAIVASKALLYVDTVQLTDNMGDLKRGPDDEVYIGGGRPDGATAYMHVIISPNTAGTGNKSVPNAITLAAGMWSYRGLPNDIVLMNAPDTIAVTKNISACFTDSIALIADTGKDYRWQDNSTSRQFTAHQNGIYTVGYINGNCNYEKETIRLNFVHVPTVSPAGYTCDGQKQGSAWTKPVIGDTATFIYTWKDANGTTLKQRATNTADTITGLDTGSYAVNIHTPGGCDTTLWVQILSIPSRAAANADSALCKGAIASFSATTDAPVWKWYFGDGSNSNSLNVAHTYLNAGDYIARFVATNIEGCTDTITKEVRVKTFKITLSSDKEIVNIGEAIQLVATGDQPFSVTVWEPQALFADQFTVSQIVVMDTTYQFTVIGRSIDGCADSAAISIAVNPQVYLPNTFTPNGDGLNDRFRPRTAGAGVFIDDFKIYNRWGQIVWFGYGAAGTEGWDGKIHGIDADMGTYFYTIRMVTPSGGAISLKGDITLIR